MFRRSLAPALMLAVAITTIGCSKPSEPATADGLAQRSIEGVEVDKLDLDDKTAMGFLAPVGVETGVKDAAHMTSNVGAITIYQYDDEASAKAAMEVWRTGSELTMPVAFLSPGDPVEGVDADENVAVEFASGSGNTPYLAARKGAFVVVSFGAPEAATPVVNAIMAGVDGEGIATE